MADVRRLLSNDVLSLSADVKDAITAVGIGLTFVGVVVGALSAHVYRLKQWRYERRYESVAAFIAHLLETSDALIAYDTKLNALIKKNTNSSEAADRLKARQSVEQAKAELDDLAAGIWVHEYKVVLVASLSLAQATMSVSRELNEWISATDQVFQVFLSTKGTHAMSEDQAKGLKKHRDRMGSAADEVLRRARGDIRANEWRPFKRAKRREDEFIASLKLSMKKNHLET